MRERNDRMIAAVTMMPEIQSLQRHAAFSRWRNSWGSSTLVRCIQIRYLPPSQQTGANAAKRNAM